MNQDILEYNTLKNDHDEIGNFYSQRTVKIIQDEDATPTIL